MEINSRILLYSDMSSCIPGDALSKTGEKDRWRLVDYETESGIKGAMVFATPEVALQEIELPLNAGGTYEIYVGINYTRSSLGDVLHHVEFPLYGQTWVKLTDDPGFSRFSAEIMWRHAEMFKSKTGKETDIWNAIHETYWKTADVTGQSIVIRIPGEPYNRPEIQQVANLSYVKLVPISKNNTNQCRDTDKEDDTKKIAMLWCSGMLTGHTMGNPMYNPTDIQWFREEFQPFIDSDIGIFVFEAIRGNLCTFKTNIGDVGTKDNSWPDNWVDPLEAFTTLARENDMKIFAGLRMIGTGYPVVRNPINWSRFYWKHQEWAKRDRDGVPCSNLSIAFPEVREYYLGMMKEALNYGIDGIQLHLNRCFPFVLYEDPVRNSFIAEYGEDPVSIDTDDPRWLKHCAGFVTQFLREIRVLLDEKPGRELAVTIWPFLSTPEKGYDIIKNQCDVTTWIQEGLVDYLMPTYEVQPELIRHWKEISNGRIKIWPDLMPRTQPGSAYAALAKKYYDAGADGIALWDGERRAPRASEWAVLRHLGHKNLLDNMIESADCYFKREPLKYLNGLSVENSFSDG